jgi:hypothetical protein
MFFFIASLWVLAYLWAKEVRAQSATPPTPIQTEPLGTRWKAVIKGQKGKPMMVEAPTEELAIREILKQRVDPRGILELTRI